MSDDNSKKAVKAGIWYTFSNFLSKGLVFLTTPIFTRILTTSQYGEYSNFATWQNLLMILVTFELYSTIARAKYDFEENIDKYISTITLTGTLFTMVCYVIVILFMPFFSDLFALEPKYIHIMFIYMLTAPSLQIFQAKNRIFMQYKSATFLTISSSIISVIISIIFVFLANDKLFGRIFGQEITLILFNTTIFVWILLKGKSFNVNYAKYALLIALPLIPHLLAGNLLGSSDKIVIQKLCGSKDLAFYSLAFNCASLARVLWDSLNQAMIPWLFDKLSMKEYKKISKISKYYVFLFMIVALGIMLFVPEVILVFGGKQYLDAKYVMPPIIMGSCFQFVYALYVNIEMYKKKTFSVSIGTLLATSLNIPLNYFFVEKFGYIAAAYTTLFCYGLLLLFHYLIVRYMNMHIVYFNKYNAIILSLMCIITLLMNYVYQIELLRRILLSVYIFALLFTILHYRNDIKRLIFSRHG